MKTKLKFQDLRSWLGMYRFNMGSDSEQANGWQGLCSPEFGKLYARAEKLEKDVLAVIKKYGLDQE